MSLLESNVFRHSSKDLRDALTLALAALSEMPSPVQATPIPNTIIGCHINRAETLLGTFKHFYSEWDARAPCQIFLAGNQYAKEKKFDDDDLVASRAFIESAGARVYIHAPYSINLSKPRNKKSIDDDESGSWSLKLLIYQLEVADIIGSRGVVVHVGKPGLPGKGKTVVPVETAKANMIAGIREVLSVCSPRCQIIIETPAGQGTELYTSAQELWDFWNEFTPSEHSRMGICIDTCHVFAAGHDPIEYLEFWLNHDSTAIALVHYNDSLMDRGAKKDRHAPIGNGKIGAAILEKFANIAGAYGIPMVME